MERKKALSSIRIMLWLLPLLSTKVSECQDDVGYYSHSEEFNCPEARVCSVPLDPYEELVDLLCRCDSNCTFYGDCCDSFVQSLDSAGNDVAGRLDGLLECRSIHLDEMTQPAWGESFWMVSACPVEWMAGRDDQLGPEILNNCSRDSDDLPPVTDLQTGLVYKNEYCAVCHKVTSLIRWEYTFQCHPVLSQLASEPNFSLTVGIIQRWCIVCGFRKPNLTDSAVPAPRECVHHSLVRDSCLEREDLQPITEKLYQELVNQCKNGSYNPVIKLVNCTYPFRNQYCALCNGIQVSNQTLRCANPYHYQSSTNYCYLDAQSISESVTPVTEESAIPEPTMTTTQPSSTPTRFARAYHDSDLNVSKEIITDILIPVANCEREVIIGGDVVPFTLFVDPNRNTQTITVGTKTVRFNTTCGEGEVFDHINNRCRETACQELAQGENCIITLFNGNISSTNGSLNDSYLCEEGSLIQLNRSEFTVVDNEALNFGGEVYEIVGYINGSPVICTNLSQNGTHEVTVIFYSYPIGIIILTYVGCLLSVIGCVVVLLTYSLFKELRTLPGKILMNLSAAILATSLFLLAGIPLFALAEKEELCHMTAIFLH